jgi:hypothetical protein
LYASISNSGFYHLTYCLTQVIFSDNITDSDKLLSPGSSVLLKAKAGIKKPALRDEPAKNNDEKEEVNTPFVKPLRQLVTKL